jgi:hypothetical protein
MKTVVKFLAFVLVAGLLIAAGFMPQTVVHSDWVKDGVDSYRAAPGSFRALK